MLTKMLIGKQRDELEQLRLDMAVNRHGLRSDRMAAHRMLGRFMSRPAGPALAFAAGCVGAFLKDVETVRALPRMALIRTATQVFDLIG